jgi:CHASE2 domain-containing sensor protein
VFVHAQLVAQLIDQDRRPIHILSWPIWVGVLLSAIVGGFLAGRSERLARHHPWLEIGTIVGFIILSILAFLFGRFIFPFIAVVLGWGWGEMVGSYWRPSGANH